MDLTHPSPLSPIITATTAQGNFLNGGHCCKNWTPALEAQFDLWCASLLRANPDFQTDKGYPRKGPGTANPAVCSAQITERFGCFAGTLEMPFKDTADEFPQPETGWSPARSRKLGGSLLDAFHTLTAHLAE